MHTSMPTTAVPQDRLRALIDERRRIEEDAKGHRTAQGKAKSGGEGEGDGAPPPPPRSPCHCTGIVLP